MSSVAPQLAKVLTHFTHSVVVVEVEDFSLALSLKLFSFSQQIGPFETTSAELRELRPGRPYLVQVCAQELLGLGECSEWSEALSVTVPKVKL